MNLLLRPLDDVADVTWSIVVMMLILLAAVVYVIVYILGYDEMTDGHYQPERRESGPGDSTPQTSDRGQREDVRGTSGTSSQT